MLQLDGINWKVGSLGNQVLIFEPQIDLEHLDYIHRFNSVLEEQVIGEILDVVPAYTSIAIFYEGEASDLLKKLKALDFQQQADSEPAQFDITVNYAHGLDWDRVCSITGLSKSEFIERHSKPIYKVAMIGFLPGFIFLEGLDPALPTPRLDTPRTHIPEGAVGVGGSQTGIYSLESPGGWNIIGKTENTFFDIENDPPISIKIGDQVKFNPIFD